jgi:hypothetical protein
VAAPLAGALAAKPYPPLATLQAAAALRNSGYCVNVFDAMLAEGPSIEALQVRAAAAMP